MKQAKTLQKVLGEKLPLYVSCTDNICEGCELSLIRVVTYKDRIYVHIKKNTGQWKYFSSHVLRRVQQLNLPYFMYCRKKIIQFLFLIDLVGGNDLNQNSNWGSVLPTNLFCIFQKLD